ncbi:hypothetical protein [Blattabacterium cuenoti]|uniref:hypothetical protein n=1 Tax=Blattabacterium cuenoti TaxID=1653831 RepID=UPI00311D68E3
MEFYSYRCLSKERIFFKNANTVILKIVYTESVKKRRYLITTIKLLFVGTGTILLIPSFIKIGEFLKINTKKIDLI